MGGRCDGWMGLLRSRYVAHPLLQLLSVVRKVRRKMCSPALAIVGLWCRKGRRRFGIHGVLSHSVTQRIPEIGVRMALGASGAQVRARVVGRTMALAGIGVPLGGVGSLVVSRFLSSMLYGVEGTDPATFGGMTILLLGVAALAGYLPAARAAKTDPVEALRSGVTQPRPSKTRPSHESRSLRRLA